MPDFDVLTFISRFPLLTHLTIASTEASRIDHHGNPLIPFQHLETLRAPPSFIQYFLRHPTSCPKIRDICTAWPPCSP